MAHSTSKASSVLEIKDKFGNEIFVGNGGDIWFPPFPSIQDYRQHVANLRHLQLRPDDVIITGFPKTGSHWHHEIIHMLIQGSDSYFQSEGPQEFLDRTPNPPPPEKPRVFYTHFRYHHLPLQEIREKGAKVVYLTRNPKDTWVSMYNFAHGRKDVMGYHGTWSHFFEVMVDMGFWYGDWFDYVLDWEEELSKTDISYLVSGFEEMKKDPVGQIEKLNQFLGYNRDHELCEKIATACHFDVMKEAKEAMLPAAFKQSFKENASGIFRKGKFGDWKNWFTVAQNERFDALYAKRMSGSGQTFIFE